MSAVTDMQVQDIDGAFSGEDFNVFRFFLSTGGDVGGPGDVAELGAYKGRSAVLIGSYLAPGEIFTVVDLFGGEAGDAANSAENRVQYPNLARSQFETNYLAIHGVLPQIVSGFSQAVVNYARHGTHRFVHIDASHLYDHVRVDVESAKMLLRPAGIASFDDYRSPHTPGVAAAVWQAMSSDLIPLLVTPNKLYAAKKEAGAWVERLQAWAPISGLQYETQVIAGFEVMRVWQNHPTPWLGARNYLPPVLLYAFRSLRRRVADRNS